MKIGFIFCFSVILYLNPTKGFNCTGKSDGAYEMSCHQYIQCNNGLATVVKCQRPQVVNKITGTCHDPQSILFPCGTYLDCSGKDDGLYPDVEMDCQYYFVCSNGAYKGHSPCPLGLVLNSETQRCDFKTNVKQPCGVLPNTGS